MAAALARWLTAQEYRRYTYRILFLPETIGALVYLRQHGEWMKRATIAGFVLTCCGDKGAFTFLPSRLGTSLADRVARHVLDHDYPDHKRVSFLDRGSDERQYCSPGIDLPVVSIMRSMYGRYPEYHTSLDDLSLIAPDGLKGTFDILVKCIEVLEANAVYRTSVCGEPHLSSRGLYPTLSTKESAAQVRDILNFLAYADGNHDLIGIAERIGLDALKCHQIGDRLVAEGLLNGPRIMSAHETRTLPHRRYGRRVGTCSSQLYILPSNSRVVISKKRRCENDHAFPRPILVSRSPPPSAK